MTIDRQSDTISRQAAIAALKDMYHAAEKWGEEASDDVIKARAESCMASLVEMKLRIEKLPSAEPVRMKGEWVDARDGYDAHVKCTMCFKTYDWVSQAQYYNFCPNCGASMSEGEEE